LFIDTTSGAGKGDEFNLELGANMLQAQDGQFMRLTLVNFNMYNSIYPVNATNNKFRIVSRYGPPQNVSQFLGLSTLNSIPSKNYKTCATTLRPGDFPSLLLLKPNCLLCDLSITKNLPCPEKGRRFFALERAAVTGHGMELRGAGRVGADQRPPKGPLWRRG